MRIENGADESADRVFSNDRRIPVDFAAAKPSVTVSTAHPEEHDDAPVQNRVLTVRNGRPRLPDVFGNLLSKDFVDQRVVPHVSASRFLRN
jgi:hypothetical protein